MKYLRAADWRTASSESGDTLRRSGEGDDGIRANDGFRRPRLKATEHHKRRHAKRTEDTPFQLAMVTRGVRRKFHIAASIAESSATPIFEK